MATNTTITTTYAGEFAGKYISAALLTASTIENNGIEIKPNIKFKEVIKVLATGDLVQNGACDFTPNSSVTLTERVISPESFMVNLNLCKADFRSDWDAVSMGYSAWDTLPKSFADFLLMHVIDKVAAKTETTIWAGKDATAGEFDGFLELAKADGTVLDVAGTPITAANVLVELGKVVDKIPTALYTKEDLHIYVASNVARAYVRALGGFGVSGLGANGVKNEGTQWYGGEALAFDGIKLFVANGMTDSFMLAAEKSNLFFGTGLMNDSQRVQVIDMTELDGSDNVRIVMKYTAAVQYGIGADIVLYTPA